jgi:hypothetical protein
LKADRARTRRTRTAALGLAYALIASLAIGASANAGAAQRHITDIRRQVAMSHSTTRMKQRRSNPRPTLTFGIYPGGAAGTVGPSGQTKPEDPGKRLAALEMLRAPGRPFVLHLYASYTGPRGLSADQQLGHEITAYGRAGFQTEVVLCYRPADGGSAADVAGFVQFVRQSLHSLGGKPGFGSLQVTNEANVGVAPNASDGYYKGAETALIKGVIAAKHDAHKAGFGGVKVGFNWAYSTDRTESEFWRRLGLDGGRRFVDALDWVGFDAFPGTWGPPLHPGDVSAATNNFVNGALTHLRSRYMPLAGIPRSVPLRVTENGYPTGPGRSAATQVTVMRAAIRAVYRARATYNITGYRWFDLRDADSSSSSFESQYGLMRDDYSPKPAFGVYRELVAALSAH